MLIRVTALFGALFVMAMAVQAQDKKDEPKVDEKKLLGKWKLTNIEPGGLPEGMEIVVNVEKGKFTITVTQGDEKDVNEGTWKLDGNKLALEFTKGSREDTKQTDTVKELTDKKLVLLDPRERTETWERIEEKKKK